MARAHPAQRSTSSSSRATPRARRRRRLSASASRRRQSVRGRDPNHARRRRPRSRRSRRRRRRRRPARAVRRSVRSCARASRQSPRSRSCRSPSGSGSGRRRHRQHRRRSSVLRSRARARTTSRRRSATSAPRAPRAKSSGSSCRGHRRRRRLRCRRRRPARRRRQSRPAAGRTGRRRRRATSSSWRRGRKRRGDGQSLASPCALSACSCRAQCNDRSPVGGVQRLLQACIQEASRPVALAALVVALRLAPHGLVHLERRPDEERPRAPERRERALVDSAAARGRVAEHAAQEETNGADDVPEAVFEGRKRGPSAQGGWETGRGGGGGGQGKRAHAPDLPAERERPEPTPLRLDLDAEDRRGYDEADTADDLGRPEEDVSGEGEVGGALLREQSGRRREERRDEHDGLAAFAFKVARDDAWQAREGRDPELTGGKGGVKPTSSRSRSVRGKAREMTPTDARSSPRTSGSRRSGNRALASGGSACTMGQGDSQRGSAGPGARPRGHDVRA